MFNFNMKNMTGFIANLVPRGLRGCIPAFNWKFSYICVWTDKFVVLEIPTFHVPGFLVLFLDSLFLVSHIAHSKRPVTAFCMLRIFC